jgi:hypothetical protein
VKKAKKKKRLWALVAFAVISAYFAASWVIDLKYAESEHEQCSKGLAATAQKAGEALQARVRGVTNSLDVFRRMYLTEYAEDKRGLGSVIDMFEEELNSFPELVSLSYMNSSSELVYARGVEGDEGEAAVNASLDWAREYWTRLAPDDEKPFCTPVKFLGRDCLQGMIFPVVIEQKIAGGLVCVVDAGTIAAKSFEYMNIPESASVFLLDAGGGVISAVGKAGPSGTLDASFATKDFMKMAMSAQNGIKRVGQPSGKKAGKSLNPGRLIAAWQQTKLGLSDAVVVVVMPEGDAAKIFRSARLTHMVLEFIFAILVSVAVAVMLIRNRRLSA